MVPPGRVRGGSYAVRMVKIRGSILHRIDVRSAQSTPFATKRSTGVWRIHVGDRTLGWARYLGEAGRDYAMYHDGTDALGRQAWCRNFPSLDAAAAWAVQHADRLVAHRRTLGPSIVVDVAREPVPS